MTKQSNDFGIGILLMLQACLSLPAAAQQVQGSFTGTVTDQTGAANPDVTVTAVEEVTGFTRSTISRNDGSYDIPLLPPGRFKFTAQKVGFQERIQEHIDLLVDQHLKVDIQMKVGAQSQTIRVVQSVPVLDTQTAAIGTTIEEEKISQVPLNGRNFLELTLFTPGVVPGTSGSENSSHGGAINVNGLRETMNGYLLDGITNTSIGVGTYVVTPPVDSVLEFRMETGVYDARFGANGGAQVNVVTKSGTNRFHGSLHEFLRNDHLDARNFFEPVVPPFKRNQFGATAGGPIVAPGIYDGHDRSFFFVAYEGLRERRGFFNRVRVPTAAEHAGNFGGDLSPSCPVTNLLLDPLLLTNPNAPLTVPNNNVANLFPLLPGKGPDPLGVAFSGLYPAPNIPSGSCGSPNYQALVNRNINLDSFVGRVDHRWGGKNNMFFRYNLTSDHEVVPSNRRTFFTDLPGYGQKALNGFQVAGLDWTHTFSAKLINEAKVAYNRWQQNTAVEDEGNPFAQQVGIKGLATARRDTGIPNLVMTGYAPIGSSVTRPQFGAVNTFEFADTLNHIHGNHFVSYGAETRTIKRGNFFQDVQIRSEYNFTGLATGGLVLQALQRKLSPAQYQATLNQLLAACPPPRCTFGNGLADDLLGLPTDWINGFGAYISGAGSELGFFATDNWKVRRNLTFNLGLRYEYNTLITEKFNHFANFDFQKGELLVAGTNAATLMQFDPTTRSFVATGSEPFGSTSENRALQHPDKNNWAPRFGFAWQPRNSSRTVVRGGYGVFYDQTFGDVYFQRAQNPPFLKLNVGNIGATLPAIIGGTLPLGSGALIQNAFVAAAAPLFPILRPFQTNFDDSFIQEWTLNVQRELPGAWLVEMGYVGTRGLHLPRRTDPNQAINLSVNNSAVTLAECTSPLGCLKPYPLYSQMAYAESSGSSIYHSLQLKVERHFAQGLAVIGGYTYSKSIDTNSTFLGDNANSNFAQNSHDLAAEKALSDFDHRHRLSLAYVYDLPFGKSQTGGPRNYLIQGWQLAGIVTAQTGSPFTPVISGDISGASEEPGDTTDRPNIVANPIPSNQGPNQWISPLAFSAPARFTFGNAGRNTLTGPGVASWDFSLNRRFRLTESKSLELRTEVFNITNRANFDLPVSDLASPSFGKIFNTVQPEAGFASGGPGDPREIQFALKLIW